MLQERPGTPKQSIADAFGLSAYRLNRMFRCIERNLDGICIAHEPGRGVWLVALDAAQCSGIEWVGVSDGGFRQCRESPQFPDGRCYAHSLYECPEMVALARQINYLAGPGEPCVRSLSLVSELVLEDLLAALTSIEPITMADTKNKAKFHRLLRGALSFRLWKDSIRRQSLGNEIPFDFRSRHRNSSGNPYEFTLRKCFLLLRIPSDSGRDEVLKAWKKMALLHHPDAAGGDGDEDMMKAVNEAKDRIFSMKGWD